MAKQIKIPLIMPDNKQVRNIEELRENFDLVTTIEYFTTGRLQRWLECYYYDDILEKIQKLTGEEDDFAERLVSAIGAEIKEDNVSTKDIMRQTKLKEELKRSIEEKELDGMEHIAESQEDLEQYVKAGYQKIYLYGEKFTIPKDMKNAECIGINEPVISVEADVREDYLAQNVSLQKVKIADARVRRIVVNEPVLDSYTEILKEFLGCLEQIEKNVGGR